jgi:uncharacterized repeat protein (TIGR03803 family)
MNVRYRLTAGALMAVGLGIALISAADAASVHPGKTLYSFAGAPDGEYPNGDLIVDDMGVYYGTTGLGGVITGDCPAGCGTVYKVVDGQESVIYRFTGVSDGAVPVDGLFLDAESNLYGVTSVGGDSDMGTVFKISPDGSKTTLHSFAGGTEDGATPNGDLIADADGNLYGTTRLGGIGDCDGGCGTVFKITPDGQENILHAFDGAPGASGVTPHGGLIADTEGILYGTTYGGGKTGCGTQGCGTIFKLTPDGRASGIHNFDGGRSAGHPRDRLLVDAQGNFYGTSFNGGTRNFGAVWKVSADGSTETVLYSFHHHADGVGVNGGLVADLEGNLYGTTFYGGENLVGEVYRVTPEGQFATLYTFPDITLNYSSAPFGRLLIDHQGNLIGTTISLLSSDANKGTIFLVKN